MKGSRVLWGWAVLLWAGHSSTAWPFPTLVATDCDFTETNRPTNRLPTYLLPYPPAGVRPSLPVLSQHTMEYRQQSVVSWTELDAPTSD